MGYPAGIGPEVMSKALASPAIKGLANFLVVGNEEFFKKANSRHGCNIRYKKIDDETEIDFLKSNINFFDMKQVRKVNFSHGVISAALGKESIRYIEKAVELIKSKRADVMVTAPINKHAACLSGFKYNGHTEFLAHLTGTQKYAMMLTAGRLNVFLATTHIPVKDISRCLNKKQISDKLVLADLFFKNYFKKNEPVIAVCGLNPHAGDNGLIGNEEKKIIIPAIKDAIRKGVNAKGPFAADGVFYYLSKGAYDAVLCMYHDQGLVALKMAGRNNAVNITVGLPFIRTSPGHGTALDIAGKGTADPESMKYAIKMAVDMHHKKEKGKRKKEKGKRKKVKIRRSDYIIC
jgi:4-hydroxythreonine-4-phosphate dehydrogenase